MDFRLAGLLGNITWYITLLFSTARSTLPKIHETTARVPSNLSVMFYPVGWNDPSWYDHRRGNFVPWAWADFLLQHRKNVLFILLSGLSYKRLPMLLELNGLLRYRLCALGASVSPWCAMWIAAACFLFSFFFFATIVTSPHETSALSF